MPLSFVYDNLTIDLDKTDKNPLQLTDSIQNFLPSTQYVTLGGYINDVRAALISAKYFGYARQASNPAGAMDNVFLRTDGSLVLHLANGQEAVLGSPSNGAYTTMSNAGVALTARNTLNVDGENVIMVDNPGSTRTELTLADNGPGGTGGTFGGGSSFINQIVVNSKGDVTAVTTSVPSGGGNIAGTLAAPRIPFATAPNVLGDSANLEWDNAGKALNIGAGGKVNVGTHVPSVGYSLSLGSDEVITTNTNLLELEPQWTVNVDGLYLSAVDSDLLVDGTGNLTGLQGTGMYVQYIGSGNIDYLSAHDTYVAINGGVTSQVSVLSAAGAVGQNGHVVSAAMLHAHDFDVFDGKTVENVQGLLIDDIVNGTNSNYAIKSGLGQVLLGDDGGANAFDNAILQLNHGASTPGHYYAIAVNRAGGQSLMLGINKETDTVGVPANSVFLATYLEGGFITIGRGDNGGNPKHADILVDNNGNVGLFDFDRSKFNGGATTLGMANTPVVPNMNATSGGFLYASGGALFWRGSAGTVTPLAPA